MSRNEGDLSKKCIKCHTVKLRKDFDWRKDGKRRIQVCRECRITPAAASVTRFAALRAKRSGLAENGKTDCTQCRQVKPFDEFSKSNGTHTNLCKSCLAKRGREFYKRLSPEERTRRRLKYEASMRSNPDWLATNALRVRTRAVLSRFVISKKSKSRMAIDLVGCSSKELRRYLELQFTHGMSWENYGKDGWHIDHVMPLSSFDLSDEDQRAKACHYTNMQPLWDIENKRKYNSIPKSHQPLLLLT